MPYENENGLVTTAEGEKSIVLAIRGFPATRDDN
jgi:hypothetical protein